MDTTTRRGRTPALPSFLRAAWRYWATIWPLTARETRRWRALAAAIPDPGLRAAALENLREERGNLEGAAAFAVLAPPGTRPALVRALVAFQAIYDCADTLVERREGCSAADARRLHGELRAALDLTAGPRAGRCRDRVQTDDGGYLAGLAASCRAAVATLPGWPTAAPAALAAVDRMIEYQVRNHATASAPADALAQWAREAASAAQRPGDAGSRGAARWQGDHEPGFAWWERAAAAASSLVVFALMARAAAGELADGEAEQVVAAYLPAGALHVLLDSLVDRSADERSGDHSLVAHYPGAAEQARRLASLATQALDRTDALRDGGTHRLILVAMTSFYLSASASGEERLAAAALRAALGPAAIPAVLVLSLRRLAARGARLIPTCK